jgi:hypothetical protein
MWKMPEYNSQKKGTKEMLTRCHLLPALWHLFPANCVTLVIKQEKTM